MRGEQPADMLARLGSDGLLWAQEFNKIAVRLGYSEMDEGWLIGWFANAIENSCNPLRNECDCLREENARLRETLQYIADPYNNSTTSKDRLAFLARAAIREGGKDE